MKSHFEKILISYYPLETRVRFLITPSKLGFGFLLPLQKLHTLFPITHWNLTNNSIVQLRTTSCSKFLLSLRDYLA